MDLIVAFQGGIYGCNSVFFKLKQKFAVPGLQDLAQGQAVIRIASKTIWSGLVNRLDSKWPWEGGGGVGGEDAGEGGGGGALVACPVLSTLKVELNAYQPK